MMTCLTTRNMYNIFKSPAEVEGYLKCFLAQFCWGNTVHYTVHVEKQ